MYGRASLPAPLTNRPFEEEIWHWRKEGRSRRPARTLFFSIPLKPGSFFTSPKLVRDGLTLYHILAIHPSEQLCREMFPC